MASAPVYVNKKVLVAPGVIYPKKWLTPDVIWGEALADVAASCPPWPWSDLSPIKSTGTGSAMSNLADYSRQFSSGPSQLVKVSITKTVCYSFSILIYARLNCISSFTYSNDDLLR